MTDATTLKGHFTSVDPSTGRAYDTFEELDRDELEARLRQAEHAFSRWGRSRVADRCAALGRLGERMRQGVEGHARMISREMGKPITQSRAEVEKCGWVCEFYADHAAEFLAHRQVETDARSSHVEYAPLGGVLAIMPWNYPFWQVFRCAVPALAAGNVVLLKHAENVPNCALAIDRLFRSAEFPTGVFTGLLISSERVPDVLADPFVRGVSLTGSARAGRSVAETAGRHLVRSVLELGGSDPFLVLADADLESTIEGAVQGRTQNTGQSCIAAKRFLVHEDVHDRFVERLVEAFEALVVGDPLDDETDIGPLAREDLRDTLDEQVRDSVAAGATVWTGGEPLDRDGWYYPPTVLADVTPTMRAFREETFGPVAAVLPFHDVEEAVALANDCEYGLGASVWTSDAARGERIAHRLDAGVVSVNAIVKSDPRLPFGGIKNSGWGRELGREGILEFVNQKTVWVA